MLSEDDFWLMIRRAISRGTLDVDALSSALSERPRTDWHRFQKILDDSIGRLEAPAVRREIVTGIRADDRESDDGFLDACAGIISLGREYFASVMEQPMLLRGLPVPECEDLLYVADSLIYPDDDEGESDDSIFPIVTHGSVRKELYPVPKRELEQGFPIETFSWLEMWVQDVRRPPQNIVRHPGGEIALHPYDDEFSDVFEEAAFAAQTAIRGVVDFRCIPDMLLTIIVRVGAEPEGPRLELVAHEMHPESIAHGTVIDIPREDLERRSPEDLAAYAREVVRRCLETYFAGHDVEMRAIDTLR